MKRGLVLLGIFILCVAAFSFADTFNVTDDTNINLSSAAKQWR